MIVFMGVWTVSPVGAPIWRHVWRACRPGECAPQWWCPFPCLIPLKTRHPPFRCVPSCQAGQGALDAGPAMHGGLEVAQDTPAVASGVDVSPTLLYYFFKFSGQSRLIRAGSYEITKDTSAWQLLNKLVAKQPVLVQISAAKLLRDQAEECSRENGDEEVQMRHVELASQKMGMK